MSLYEEQTAIIAREDDMYVTLCPELDIASQASSVEEARHNARKLLNYFLKKPRTGKFSVAKSNNLSPFNVRMGLPVTLRQITCRFTNNLEVSDHRIDSLPVSREGITGKSVGISFYPANGFEDILQQEGQQSLRHR